MKWKAVTGLILTLLVPVSAIANEPKIEPDVVYGHKDGLAMTFDVFRPEKPNQAAVLFMVSGGWFSKWSPPEQMLPLFQPFLESGYTVFAVRHGSSPRYTIPDAVGDVQRAVRFIRYSAERFEIDAKRMGVWGMSAGGHLSLMLGCTGDDGNGGGDPIEKTSSRVAAVVALVPPTDLRVAIWSSPESLPAYRGFPALNLSAKLAEEHSPVVHATADDAPSLIVMGGADKLVPPKHGEWMDEAFEEVDVERKLIVVDGAGHGLEGDEVRARVFREAVTWFDKHLSQIDSQ